jgi:hypothetical protein
MEKTNYAHHGELYVEHVSIENLPELANNLDKEKVIAAILASQ